MKRLLVCLLLAGGVGCGESQQVEMSPGKEVSAAIPKEEAIIEFNKGIECVEKNDVETAVAYFTKAIELEPDYVDAYANRSLAYGELGDNEKASDDIGRAMELDPFSFSYQSKVRFPDRPYRPAP